MKSRITILAGCIAFLAWQVMCLESDLTKAVSQKTVYIIANDECSLKLMSQIQDDAGAD